MTGVVDSKIYLPARSNERLINETKHIGTFRRARQTGVKPLNKFKKAWSIGP